MRDFLETLAILFAFGGLMGAISAAVILFLFWMNNR